MARPRKSVTRMLRDYGSEKTREGVAFALFSMLDGWVDRYVRPRMPRKLAAREDFEDVKQNALHSIHKGFANGVFLFPNRIAAYDMFRKIVLCKIEEAKRKSSTQKRDIDREIPYDGDIHACVRLLDFKLRPTSQPGGQMVPAQELADNPNLPARIAAIVTDDPETRAILTEAIGKLDLDQQQILFYDCCGHTDTEIETVMERTRSTIFRRRTLAMIKLTEYLADE